MPQMLSVLGGLIVVAILIQTRGASAAASCTCRTSTKQPAPQEAQSGRSSRRSAGAARAQLARSTGAAQGAARAQHGAQHRGSTAPGGSMARWGARADGRGTWPRSRQLRSSRSRSRVHTAPNRVTTLHTFIHDNTGSKLSSLLACLHTFRSRSYFQPQNPTPAI